MVERQLIGELLGGTDRVDVMLVVGTSGRFRRKVGIGRWRLRGGRSRGWSYSQLARGGCCYPLPLELYCSFKYSQSSIFLRACVRLTSLRSLGVNVPALSPFLARASVWPAARGVGRCLVKGGWVGVNKDVLQRGLRTL